MDHISAQLNDRDDKTWIPVKEAADLLSLTEASIFSYASRGVFQRMGKGQSTRVLLGDIRKYADTRNPGRSSGGKARWHDQRMVLSEEEWVRLTPEIEESPSVILDLSPVSPKETALDIAYSAKAELEQIEVKMTILAVRRVELLEVVQAIETIERFATLSREGTDD